MIRGSSKSDCIEVFFMGRVEGKSQSSIKSAIMRFLANSFQLPLFHTDYRCANFTIVAKIEFKGERARDTHSG